ncbi:unnamed protein product [Camellia sinensis]
MCGFADEVDAEGDESDAEARSGVAELVRQHRVLPPLVPPPEELPCGSQWRKKIAEARPKKRSGRREARIRSQSAPRQRALTPEREKLSSAKKRLSFPVPGEAYTNGVGTSDSDVSFECNNLRSPSWKSIYREQFGMVQRPNMCFGDEGSSPSTSGGVRRFQCKTGEGHQKPGTSHLKLILKTAIPGGVIVLLGLLIVSIRCGKKLNCVSSFVFSRNTSSDPSSKADLEGGSVYFGVPVFSYTELEEATNNFDPSKELGDGGFGTVYHGKLQDGRDVAVKRLYEHNYRRIAQFMNEIKILTHLHHRNLVSLYGCTSRLSRELLLIYEYIPNGTVANHIHGDRAKDRPLLWPIRMSIAIETASALTYLHASDIIHRDVKTNNILLDNDFCVKVADFGLSRLFPIGVTHVSTAPQGTPGYVDPEYRQCYQHY